MSAHPSFLRLDRLALGADDREAAAHATSCSGCAAHLERCAQRLSVPGWAGALAHPRRTRWWRSPHLVAIGGMAALAVVVAIGPRLAPREGVSSKGSPAVAVYVKRGERVVLWNGVQPLHAGDSVQLRVQPAGFAHVTVGAVEGTTVHELYRAESAGNSTLLVAQAFTLDGASPDERLLVVFSQSPLSDRDLHDAREKLPRDARLWATLLDLTKAGEHR